MSLFLLEIQPIEEKGVRMAQTTYMYVVRSQRVNESWWNSQNHPITIILAQILDLNEFWAFWKFLIYSLTRWLRHYFEKNLKNHHKFLNLQLHVTHTFLHFQIPKRWLLWKIILSSFKWWKFQCRISFSLWDTADWRERGKNSPNYVYIRSPQSTC